MPAIAARTFIDGVQEHVIPQVLISIKCASKIWDLPAAISKGVVLCLMPSFTVPSGSVILIGSFGNLARSASFRSLIFWKNCPQKYSSVIASACNEMRHRATFRCRSSTEQENEGRKSKLPPDAPPGRQACHPAPCLAILAQLAPDTRTEPTSVHESRNFSVQT